MTTGTEPAEPRSSPSSGEFGRIKRYFKPLAAAFPGSLGLTNDAAVFAVPSGCELVVTSDGMVAGVHFFPDDDPRDIAAKLMRVNLSDLASMGAEPLTYTLVTALPAALPESWLAAFAAALGEEQGRYGIGLAGGDSVSTTGPITLSLTAMGLVTAGQALPRRSPRPAGDPVFITGTIGDAALGLLVARGSLATADSADRAFLLGRLRRPEPRLSVGRALPGLAASCIDVSDGLVADLGHLAEESGCAAVLAAEKVPLSPAARRVIAGDSDRLLGALTGGDDYELLFTAPAQSRRRVAELAAATQVPITEIGHTLDGPAGQVQITDDRGGILVPPSAGWTHF